MASQLRRAVVLLEYLDSLNSQARKKFIKNANKNVVQTIVDVLHNINIGTVPLNETIVDKLRRYKTIIKAVTLPKKSLARRRQELIKKDVFFLKIFPVLLPVLIQLIQPQTPSKLQRPDNEDGIQSSHAAASGESEKDVADK